MAIVEPSSITICHEDGYTLIEQIHSELRYKKLKQDITRNKTFTHLPNGIVVGSLKMFLKGPIK